MFRAPRTLTITLVTLALVAATLGVAAQEPSNDDSSALIQAALDHLAAGDAEAAVELLEPIRRDPDASPQLRALLGTAYLEAGQVGDAASMLAPLADDENADPAVLYNAARAALATGEIERAEMYLERSVALQPGTPAARELGLLRGQEGRMRDAYRLLRPWVASQQDDTEARLAAAMAAIQIERIPDAELFLSGLPIESPRVRLLWAQLRLIQNDPQGALAMLAPILDEPPPEMEMDILRTAAEAHLSNGNPQRALDLLQDRAEADPATALKLAQALDETGQLDVALETMKPFADRLLEIFDEASGQMDNRTLAASYAREYGRMLAAAGRSEEAIPYLQLAINLTPRKVEAWKLMGNALAEVGRNDEAAAARKRFDELTGGVDPTTTTAEQRSAGAADPTGREIGRARRMLAEGRAAQALAVVQAEKELAPEDVRVWLMETRILLLDKRPGEALQLAEETARQFPEFVDAYYQRGAAHLALEHYEQAEEDFRRALDLDADHVPSMNDLAVLLIIRDRQAEAERLLERILELQPDNVVAAQTLDRLHAKR